MLFLMKIRCKLGVKPDMARMPGQGSEAVMPPKKVRISADAFFLLKMALFVASITFIFNKKNLVQ